MLAQSVPPALSLTIGGFAVTWIALLALFLRQRKQVSVLQEALKGTSGERLEPLLQDHLRTKQKLSTDYDEVRSRIQGLEDWSKGAVSKVGFVRYDAFGDTGGMQSFALALQNEHGDGVVLTTIVGREQIRLYGKSISAGACEQTLTPEEQEALKLAQRGRR